MITFYEPVLSTDPKVMHEPLTRVDALALFASALHEVASVVDPQLADIVKRNYDALSSR